MLTGIGTAAAKSFHCMYEQACRLYTLSVDNIVRNCVEVSKALDFKEDFFTALK